MIFDVLIQSGKHEYGSFLATAKINLGTAEHRRK